MLKDIILEILDQYKEYHLKILKSWDRLTMEIEYLTENFGDFPSSVDLLSIHVNKFTYVFCLVCPVYKFSSSDFCGTFICVFQSGPHAGAALFVFELNVDCSKLPGHLIEVAICRTFIVIDKR